MSAIRGTFRDGKIVFDTPPDWPDGKTVLVTDPDEGGELVMLTEDEQGDDPESIARWLAWFDSLEPLVLTPEDEEIIQRMVRRHFELTRSERAEEVLRKWNDFAPKFVKVFPRDLKLALEARIDARTGDG